MAKSIKKQYKIISKSTNATYFTSTIQLNFNEFGNAKVFIDNNTILVSYEEVWNYRRLEELLDGDFDITLDNSPQTITKQITQT